MYETYYGFREKPFNLTPDPKYLYLSRRHTEAFAHLEFGRRERGGFAVITGEVGTGKTTLSRYFLSQLGPNTATAVVLYPALSAAELLRSILEDLKVEARSHSLKDLVDALHRFLLEARAQQREVVLLIDEAQNLSAEVLEQIRLLSNLETDTEKLIQIVLMGQSELQEKLARRELRQLAQRVTARYHLEPLNRQEAEEYILHRLAVAGGEGKVVFTPGSLTAIHRLSQGLPRLINVICDRSLLAGYVHGTRTIIPAIVARAAAEVAGRPEARTLPGRMPILLRLPMPYAAAGLGLAVLGVVGAAVWLLGATQPLAAVAAPSPAPAVLPLSPSPPPSPRQTLQAGLLEGVLLAAPRETSFHDAVGAVQARWGDARLEATYLRTHLSQVRRLDVPVVLEMFHPARRDTCFVALLQIDGDAAVLSAGGAPFRVAVMEMDQHWTRQALFLWRDFESLAQGVQPERARVWASQHLLRLGYLTDDGDFVGALTRFQRDLELAPDGLIGSRTLLGLYARGDYPRPRLVVGGTS